MGQVCFYIVKKDTGFAPNPFHGWCTLAACTPNHVNARLERGDFIAGVFRSGGPPRLAYIMEVAEVYDYDSYYRDLRFAKKKPRSNGTWRERAGDNMYFLDESGAYVQDANACFHTDKARIAKDVKNAVVFLGRHFAYFGERAETDEALLLPSEVHWCLPQRGLKYLIEGARGHYGFVTWAFSHGTGILGLPRDREREDEPCNDSGVCPPRKPRDS